MRSGLGLSALHDLAAALREEGGLIGAAVAGPGDAASRHGQDVAAGPRAAGHEAEYALLVEAIREGYELHYGAGRVVRTDDADLRLLAGDRLYALGLARLAALGDLEAVGVLADLISVCAQSHAEQDPARAEAAWRAAVRAIGGAHAI